MAINKTINDRFNEVKDYFGLSVNKFAKMIGISQPSAKAIIDGHNEPSNKAIDGLAKGFPMISMEWLLRGIGNMLNGCGCTSPDDPSLYGKTPSASIDGVSTDLQRTHNGGTTEAERIKFLEEQVAFYKEQTAYYKEMAERKDKQ
jgi:hypothetical protein